MTKIYPVTVLLTIESTVMGSHAEMPMPRQPLSLLRLRSGEALGLRSIRLSPLVVELEVLAALAALAVLVGYVEAGVSLLVSVVSSSLSSVTVLVTVESTVIGSHALIPMPKQLLSLLRPRSGEIVGLMLINESPEPPAKLIRESAVEVELGAELTAEPVLDLDLVVVSVEVELTVMGSHTEMPMPRHELSLLRLRLGLTVGLRLRMLSRLCSARKSGRLRAMPRNERMK